MCYLPKLRATVSWKIRNATRKASESNVDCLSCKTKPSILTPAAKLLHLTGTIIYNRSSGIKMQTHGRKGRRVTQVFSNLGMKTCQHQEPEQALFSCAPMTNMMTLATAYAPRQEGIFRQSCCSGFLHFCRPGRFTSKAEDE